MTAPAHVAPGLDPVLQRLADEITSYEAGVEDLRVAPTVVLSPFAEPGDVGRLSSTLERINRLRPDSVPFEIVERGGPEADAARELELRERGLRMTAVEGSAARVFRNPHEHGSFGAPRLGRLHPLLPRVSRRSLLQLAEEHGLERVRAFGSAVRGDFRPDSEIDLMIEPAPGIRLRISNLVDIRERLEGSSTAMSISSMPAS